MLELANHKKTAVILGVLLCIPMAFIILFAAQFSSVEQIFTDVSKATVVLPDGEKLTFTDHLILVLAAMDPAYYYRGYTVKITYENGDYDILSPTGQLYDSGEKYIEDGWNCDEDKWNSFIEKYFAVNESGKTTSEPIT